MNFNMPRCVSSSTELFADLSDLKTKSREHGIEYARFADAGVAGECANLAFERGF